MRGLLKASGKSFFLLLRKSHVKSAVLHFHLDISKKVDKCCLVLLATRGAKQTMWPILEKEEQRDGICVRPRFWDAKSSYPKGHCTSGFFCMCAYYLSQFVDVFCYLEPHTSLLVQLFFLSGSPFHSYCAWTSSDFFRIRGIRIGHRVKMF